MIVVALFVQKVGTHPCDTAISLVYADHDLGLAVLDGGYGQLNEEASFGDLLLGYDDGLLAYHLDACFVEVLDHESYRDFLCGLVGDLYVVKIAHGLLIDGVIERARGAKYGRFYWRAATRKGKTEYPDE